MPSVFTHDLVLEDASAGTPIYGYMLAKARNGAPRSSIRSFRSIAPRVLSDAELSESQFDQLVEGLFTQSDWSGGMGAFDARLHPGKLASGYKIDASDPGKLKLARDLVSAGTLDFAATAHRPTGYAIVGTEVWAFVGREVYSLTFATNAWVQGTTPEAAAKIYRNGVSFEGNTFAPAWVQATNVADTYIYKADADANWTLATLSGTTDVKYMAVAGSIMYGGNWSDGVHYVRTSTDPTNTGAWSGAYAVGGADSAITALVPNGDTMLVCKTDGIYVLQADGTVKNMAPEFENADEHPDNFKGAYNWFGRILLPLGNGDLWELRDGVFSDISLKRYMPRDTHLHGRVVAISGTPREVYIMVLESGNTRYHVLKAVLADITERGEYTWHHVARQAYTTGTDDDHNTLFADGIPSGSVIHNRIWMGLSSTGSTLGPFYIPGPNDTNDAYTNDDDAEALIAAFDAGFPRVTKRYSSVDFETDNLGSAGTAHNIQAYYRLTTIGGSRAGNGTGGWTSLGTLTSDRQTLTFAAETTGAIIEFLFVFIQGTTTTTSPELLKLTLRFQLRPADLKTMPLLLSFVDGQAQNNGKRDNLVRESLVQLRTWATGANEVVVRMKDSADLTATRSFTMVFLQGQFSEDVVLAEYRRFPDVLVKALVAEVG